jgi:hypothetical protein
VDRNGWNVDVYPLPPVLHNRPERIASAVEASIDSLTGQYDRIAIAYADCGTYGALDEVCSRRGLQRLPGLHCYDLYAGPSRIRQLLEEEPGTYLLTDFLVRSFERTVIQELGLDRYPELRDTYFANYTRVVWLTAKPTGNLRALAEGIATTLTLPLTIVDTRQDRLDSIIAQLVRMPSSSSNPIRSAHLTCPDSPSSDRGAQPVDTPS